MCQIALQNMRVLKEHNELDNVEVLNIIWKVLNIIWINIIMESATESPGNIVQNQSRRKKN